MSIKGNLFGAAVAAVMMVAASPAFAGEQDFTLVNHTGVEIHKFYTSPHSSAITPIRNQSHNSCF